MTYSASLTWLFDLDNTLHNADCGVFALIHHEMNRYLMQHLNLNEAAASALRADYWQRYGATLAGLQKHHPQIDIMDFLRATHPKNAINELLVAEINLPNILAQLPGKKVVFSNGPSFYVRNIIEHLSLSRYFDALLGCDNFDLCYKPNPHAYTCVLTQLNITANACIMVDDSLNNLKTAAALGMRTIWFNAQNNHAANSCDFSIHSLNELSHVVALLGIDDDSGCHKHTPPPPPIPWHNQ